MAEFLTSNAISFHIEKIIREAKTELYFLMPYLQLSREFYDALNDASKRGVYIFIIYANEDLYIEEKIKLGEITNLEIYNLENLNARCCCSEENAVITSMDMHQWAAAYNIEMGILYNKSTDGDIYKKTYNEIRSLLTSSKNMNLHKKSAGQLSEPAVKIKKVYHGFCIKCAMPISYNIDNPYCRSCAQKALSSSIDQVEVNFCHQCGTGFPEAGSVVLCDKCSEQNMQIQGAS